MNPRRLGLVELHLAVLLFGLAGLFGKLLALPPPVIVFGRTTFATLALGMVWVLTRPRGDEAPFPGRKTGWLILSGALLALHWVAFFKAIQVSTVAVGLLSFSSFPLFVTFLEPVFFRERLRALDFLTAVLVLLGLWLMVPAYELANATTQGACWGVLSGLLFALLAVINRRLVRAHAPVIVAACQNFGAALVLAPCLPGLAAPVGLREILLLALLGLGCTALAHTLFLRSLTSVRAQPASVVTCLETVYGVLFAFVLLGEVPAGPTLAGGSVILGATVVATWRRVSLQAAQQPSPALTDAQRPRR